MRVKIQFKGGPLHDQFAMTASLPEAQVFFPPADRLVLLYVRENETIYVYDHLKSKKLTDIYDAAKAKLGVEHHEEPLQFVAEDAPPERGFLPPSGSFEPPLPFCIDDRIQPEEGDGSLDAD